MAEDRPPKSSANRGRIYWPREASQSQPIPRNRPTGHFRAAIRTLADLGTLAPGSPLHDPVEPLAQLLRCHAVASRVWHSQIINRMRIEDDLDRLRSEGQLEAAALAERHPAIRGRLCAYPPTSDCAIRCALLSDMLGLMSGCGTRAQRRFRLGRLGFSPTSTRCESYSPRGGDEFCGKTASPRCADRNTHPRPRYSSGADPMGSAADRRPEVEHTRGPPFSGNRGRRFPFEHFCSPTMPYGYILYHRKSAKDAPVNETTGATRAGDRSALQGAGGVARPRRRRARRSAIVAAWSASLRPVSSPPALGESSA